MNFDEQAMKIRRGKQGILETFPRAVLQTNDDLSVLYTPGVAQPCREITKDADLSFDLSLPGKYDCRRIGRDPRPRFGRHRPGSGHAGHGREIHPVQGVRRRQCRSHLPGHEGPEEFIETVKRLQPSFAGINLEDISSPKCYDIEETLKREMDIPVFHDDQHGTAIAALAGVIGALRFVKKDLKTARIVINGAGAAGASIGRLLVRAGAGDVTMVDRPGILYAGMEGLNRVQAALADVTNKAKNRGPWPML